MLSGLAIPAAPVVPPRKAVGMEYANCDFTNQAGMAFYTEGGPSATVPQSRNDDGVLPNSQSVSHAADVEAVPLDAALALNKVGTRREGRRTCSPSEAPAT